MTISLDDLKASHVEELMEEPVVAHPNWKISQLIGLLRSTGSYEVFVESRGKVGSVSIRDLLNVPDILKAKMGPITTYVPFVRRGDTLAEAARIMSVQRLRALPVAEKDRKIVGQISARSIVKEIAETGEASTIKVGRLMSGDPIRIERKTPATRARALMIRRRIDHLPVMEDSRVWGILTSSHIMNALLPSISMEGGARGVSVRRLDYAAERLAERNILTSEVDDNLSIVGREMIRRGSTYALVMLLEELQGIVTFRDIIDLISRADVSSELPIYITGLPDDPFQAEASKKKFAATIKRLRTVMPEIEEARAVIKKHVVRGARTRYDVRVRIATPNGIRSFQESGLELPSIFDRLSDRMKKMIVRKRPLIKPSIRRRGGS